MFMVLSKKRKLNYEIKLNRDYKKCELGYGGLRA